MELTNQIRVLVVVSRKEESIKRGGEQWRNHGLKCGNMIYIRMHC